MFSRDVITYSLIEAKVLNVEFLIEPSRNCVTIISPGHLPRLREAGQQSRANKRNRGGNIKISAFGYRELNAL